jgi:hypothetical protein
MAMDSLRYFLHVLRFIFTPVHSILAFVFQNKIKKTRKKNIPAFFVCVCEVILLFIICFKIVIYFLNTLYILSIYKLYLFDFLMMSYVLSLFYFYFKIIKKEVHIYIYIC